MKSRNKIRMLAFLGIILGASVMTLLFIGAGQYVNASTEDVQTLSYNSVVMFISYEGIDGEAIDPDGIESSIVYGYSHSISNPYDPATGALTNRQHSPLRIMKPIDKATPKLIEACTKGTVIPIVSLKMYFQTDSVAKRFYVIELTNAKVTSYQGYGSVMVEDQDYDFPKETVSFTYESIKWIYTEYDDAGLYKLVVFI